MCLAVRQALAYRYKPGALAVDLHVGAVIVGLHVDRDIDRAARPGDQPSDDFVGDDRIAVQDDEVAVHGVPRDPACAQIVGDLEEGIEDHLERRSEEHTSELQSLMRISYAVFCLKTKNIPTSPRTTK